LVQTVSVHLLLELLADFFLIRNMNIVLNGEEFDNFAPYTAYVLYSDLKSSYVVCKKLLSSLLDLLMVMLGY